LIERGFEARREEAAFGQEEREGEREISSKKSVRSWTSCVPGRGEVEAE